jgi:hypothetical protein
MITNASIDPVWPNNQQYCQLNSDASRRYDYDTHLAYLFPSLLVPLFDLCKLKLHAWYMNVAAKYQAILNRYMQAVCQY